MPVRRSHELSLNATVHRIGTRIGVVPTADHAHAARPAEQTSIMEIDNHEPSALMDEALAQEPIKAQAEGVELPGPGWA